MDKERKIGSGCGSHSCLVRKPTGQGTNSGCSCEYKELRWAMQNLRSLGYIHEDDVVEGSVSDVCTYKAGATVCIREGDFCPLKGINASGNRCVHVNDRPAKVRDLIKKEG